ncbi:MAG: hypothetical protein ACRDG7_11585 [Candidatus Limnocylindria bacterium]
MPAPPSATEPPKAVRSIRLDVDVDQRARVAAVARGVPVTAFLRDLIEAGLAGLEDDTPISRADAVRALLGLRPVPPAA